MPPPAPPPPTRFQPSIHSTYLVRTNFRTNRPTPTPGPRARTAYTRRTA